VTPPVAALPATRARDAEREAADGVYRIEIIFDAETLAAHGESLERLAVNAVECNAFYETWMLLPALRAFASPGVRIVLLRERGGAIVGCVPLARDRPAWALGAARLQLWRPPYCYACTPLIAADNAPAIVDALLDWARRDLRGGLLDLHELPADGAVARLFAQALARRRWPTFASGFRRALLRPQARQTTVSSRRARELRRLERRLAGRGMVGFDVLQPGGDAIPWLERFLTMEASGWKGRRGTALASTVAARTFFVDAAVAAHRRGRLAMYALVRDGVAVAMQCNFLAGDGAYAFKVAYDERHADASPGLQLEYRVMRHLAEAESPLAWLDSCARPDHALMNRLWPERLRIARYLVATGGVVPRLTVLCLRIARSVRQVWRRMRG
jgi:CelD/BcsL family acetyltransferase involved in cellulose biosynthesis